MEFDIKEANTLFEKINKEISPRIETLLDTGFNGYIMLPNNLIKELALDEHINSILIGLNS